MQRDLSREYIGGKGGFAAYIFSDLPTPIDLSIVVYIQCIKADVNVKQQITTRCHVFIPPGIS